MEGSDAIQRSGLVPPAFNWGAMGLLTHDSFAYPTRRPGRPGHSELGACGYGPAREQLISAYTDRIRAFNRAQAGRPTSARVAAVLLVETASRPWVVRRADQVVMRDLSAPQHPAPSREGLIPLPGGADPRVAELSCLSGCLFNAAQRYDLEVVTGDRARRSCRDGTLG